MRTLIVDLPGRAYQIHIGPGLLSQGNAIAACLPRKRAVVVTNATIAPLYLDKLVSALSAEGVKPVVVSLQDGEAYKTWESVNQIHDTMLAAHCDRGVTVIALGGGVVGDLAGFAAATYQRGVAFIQLPTTLLAQVDSSVGGKTGINHRLGKNMVGAFHQPRLVVADTDTLSTLPEREYKAGLAEVIKYGLIRDLPFLEWLEANMEALVDRNADVLSEAIYRSCKNKAEVVIADETEQGERALLNLGHTFGHAIEAGMGYGVWLHGEGVAAGTMMAARLSQAMGWLSPGDVARVEKLFVRAGLPVLGPQLEADRYLEFMRLDKKSSGGKMRLILLEKVGLAKVSDQATDADIKAAILATTERKEKD